MADITTGLVAYWTFDEGSGTVANDSSGNGYTATLINSPTWAQGKVGGGLLGNNSGFEANFAFAPTNFSVTFWINPTILANYNNGIGANGCNWTGFMIHTTSGGAIYCGTDVGSRIGATSDSIYVVNQWIHMVFTFNAGVGTLYKNGTVVASKSGMSNPVAWSSFGTSGYNNLQSIIDEVRIYSRALSQDDVWDLYFYGSTTTNSITATPTNISFTTAQSGGAVDSPNTITAYGVCYSQINQIPTLADPHTVDGSLTVTNTYTSYVTQLTGLNPGNTYYVRSYATESGGTTFYGNVQIFSTLQNGIKLKSIAISVDAGTIPPFFRMTPFLKSIAISVDAGIIPPKNYFHAKLNSIAVAYDAQPINSILYFQIL